MILAPSFLAADFLHLGDACNMVNESDAEYCHLDVMDGRFVPNISFGIPVIEHIRKATTKVCDVHLMIVEPATYVEAFHKAGADILTVHVEACNDLRSVIEQIKKLGMKAGVAINPPTPIEDLYDILPYIDMVCVMSVHAGFGGQKFIPETLGRITQLKQAIAARGLQVQIEVDGGITLDNAATVIQAGADILVAGSTVFHSKNPKETIRQLMRS